MAPSRAPYVSALVDVAIAMAIAASTSACSRSRIDNLLSALQQDELQRARSTVSDLPPCAEVDESVRGACLARLAQAFGSKEGFVTDPPNHASAAAAATLVFRDHAGYVLPAPGAWSAVLERNSGTGPAIFRLAVARAMIDAVPAMSAPPTSDDAMRALLRAVAGSVPGACVTYRLLAEGKDPRTLAPELRPEHSPCVQADLARPGALGVTFGDGLPRAVAGAQSAWRATAASLRAGATKFPDPNHPLLARQVSEIEALALTPPKSDPRPNAAAALDFVHGHLDAGIIVVRDAGRRP